MRHVAIFIDAQDGARPALAGARRVRRVGSPLASVLHVRRPGEDDAARGSAIADLVASELPGAEAHALVHPDPVGATLEWADANDPDLIVVSCDDARNTSTRLRVVAQTLLDSVHCSVLVARPVETPRAGEYVHVGACVDLSDDSLAVLEEARPLVADERILDLVHVVASGARGRREIAAGIVRTLATAVHGEPVILDGDPASELLAWQARAGADLLVVAAGRPRESARGIGPVAAALAARASCDVLVARCQRPTGCVEAIPPAGLIAARA